MWSILLPKRRLGRFDQPRGAALGGHGSAAGGNRRSDWELRIDPFRVLYEVDEENRLVTIIGVGIKKRDKLIIAGEEIVI